MQRKAPRASVLLTLIVTSSLLWTTSTSAQIRILTADPASGSPANSPSKTVSLTAELDSLFGRGMKLEGAGRWGEALSLYEDALRLHHGETLPDLSARHEVAKLHYDLGRRYADSSYLKSIAAGSERDALSLYSEVLMKIQSHYVHEPNWRNLVERGASSLVVACEQPKFLQTNLGGRGVQVEALRDHLKTTIAARNIRSRGEALDAAAAIARLTSRLTGIATTPVIMEFVCAASGGLDEYSAFLTADQLNDVYSQIEGNFVGLGIELKANEGALHIVKVINGSPADRGLIRAGDRIVEVDGRSTKDVSTDQAADMLQGEEGSLVDLVVAKTNGRSQRVKVRREHVDVPSIDDVKIIDADYGIGYLKLTCFQKTTSRDLDSALWKLNRDGMKSLIMDLRGNPGGLLTSAVEVVDKFVSAGAIVSTRGRNTTEDYTYSAHKPGTWNVPLVVLIDGDSASASEIFAGAIRDHRRGKIVGSRSYGKGSVQGIFPLGSAGTGVRLTTAKFYSPLGKPISNVGVMPDLIVQSVAKPADEVVAIATDAQDPVVVAAIRSARGETAQRN